MRQLKHLSLLLGLLLLGPSTYAQSVRFQSQAISSRGAGIANATVAVCTQPANTNTQPCSPLATLATSTSTTSGGANPLTADSFGNFFFYAAPGRYTVQIYGPAVSGQFVTPDVEVGSVAGGSAGTFSNLTVSGTGTVKNLNAIQMADQFTAGTLALPTLGPGLNSLSSGGSVAANTYACEVTFVGTSGETSASPASPTITTSGATSILQCQPLDVPSGAVAYNVYWQTGAGSFFLGHSAVALGLADSQTTTPPTSGTTPPVSNTAVSVIAAAQSAVNSGGTVFVPSTLTSTAGVSGSLLSNQSIFDFRNGTFSARPTFPGNCAIKNFGSAPACNGFSYDILVPVALGNLMQVNGISTTVHAQTVATYWGGPTSVTGMVGGIFGAIRDSGRTEAIWGADIGANCSNNNGQCTGEELDIQNFSGAPVNTQNGGVGLLLLPGGNTRNYEGIRISSASAVAQTGCPASLSCVFNGIDIQPNSYQNNGIVIGSTSAANAIGISVTNPTVATGGGYVAQATASNSNSYILDNSVANQPTCILFRNNGTGLYSECQDGSNPPNWAFVDLSNGSLQRMQFNSGANGANVYQAPGTGVHSFNKSIVAGGTVATLSGTGACATFSGTVGGAFAGSAACASATAASTLTITFTSVAAHGYACNVQDETTRANLFQQTSHTTTTCVLTATSVTQNDVFVFSAIGF